MSARRLLAAALLAAAAALLPAVASAHPLGNFTVNHATVVQLDGDQLRVRHVIDMAEIPTFRRSRPWETTAPPGCCSARRWCATRCR